MNVSQIQTYKERNEIWDLGHARRTLKRLCCADSKEDRTEVRRSTRLSRLTRRTTEGLLLSESIRPRRDSLRSTASEQRLHLYDREEAVRAFWIIWALLGVTVDIYCYKTGKDTLTRTIVTTIPWFVGVWLIGLGAWHLVETWWERIGK